jgi:hypothetical protein
MTETIMMMMATTMMRMITTKIMMMLMLIISCLTVVREYEGGLLGLLLAHGAREQRAEHPALGTDDGNHDDDDDDHDDRDYNNGDDFVFLPSWASTRVASLVSFSRMGHEKSARSIPLLAPMMAVFTCTRSRTTSRRFDTRGASSSSSSARQGRHCHRHYHHHHHHQQQQQQQHQHPSSFPSSYS